MTFLSITGAGHSFGLSELGSLSGLFLLLGLGFALAAMMAGLMDLSDVPEQAQGDVNLHLLCMGGAWVAYLSALITRLDGATWPLPLPGGLSVALSIIGLALLGVGGWYGGQLVYKHGTGREHLISTKVIFLISLLNSGLYRFVFIYFFIFPLSLRIHPYIMLRRSFQAAQKQYF